MPPGLLGEAAHASFRVARPTKNSVVTLVPCAPRLPQLLTFVLLFLLSFSGFLVSAVPVGRAGARAAWADRHWLVSGDRWHACLGLLPGWALQAVLHLLRSFASSLSRLAERRWFGPSVIRGSMLLPAIVCASKSMLPAQPADCFIEPAALLQVYFKWISKISFLTYAYAAGVAQRPPRGFGGRR